MDSKQKLLVIIGPTAVGKTNLSIEMAKRYNGEIISGDSMQIYRGMDIGTAKITKEEMQGIPHHLIDIKEPEENFSVAEFQLLVRAKINEIAKRGKLPIIVGGTGLYIQSVIYDYQFSDVPGDEAFRLELEERVKQIGNDALYKELQAVDPESAAQIHPNNVRRVIRALEIFHLTGKTMQEYQRKQQPDLMYETALVGLTMDREKLYERINLRVDIMVKQGLLDEVKSLYNQGLRDCQSIQAIGYKEIYDYLDEKVTWDDAVEQLKQNSRRYAKRQLTWFRNKMDVKWFDMTYVNDLAKKIAEISQYVEGKLQVKSNTY
ncbi:tRNA (adenosine(37)-N6)-dimethylallyltransferase MiaA [Bacillus sp. AFS076308]|uniref:tRNA (adenosine(37)-N6)-dimethylallyltransferase MiaA n=1 Tax=unclassified Bacillus (in: firmicutes) TaxID=185979 RepID=UPI000BF35425|nr:MULTISPECIES: tRNA (adenosine(37)-N6)-dimethylallyltransferase MiaA [unclassified Bacillus (in: firmicutes)]PFO05789.1 tRNA (adenosine(37)-N6)-dimethylallyltransferase MiaA [Bacillus sp. AFS076308]PGV54183.1 tRNA (adenosine(37)-N6)-dimethylallyltransferase MiaA [Bacillus sp. AFS037270]